MRDQKKNVRDQATGLRGMHNGPVQVVAVTSGKGGVGKSSVSVNLSVTLAQAGRRVVLLDADLALANIDVMLGLPVNANLSHVLEGECCIDDILVEGPCGIRIAPASSGRRWMAQLSTTQHSGIIQAFGEMQSGIDTLVIDTAAGIAESVTQFSQTAHEVVVVVCDEPTSLADAYALIKVMSRDFGVERFQIVTNMVESQAAGKELYRKLSRVTDRFLDVRLYLMGVVPSDTYLKKAIEQQCAVAELYPGSKSAMAFKELASVVGRWKMPAGPRGGVEFFIERQTLNNQAVAGEV